ncbi:MAG: hypothetical protein QM681_12440 [Novosphingobium sp.]
MLFTRYLPSQQAGEAKNGGIRLWRKLWLPGRRRAAAFHTASSSVAMRSLIRDLKDGHRGSEVGEEGRGLRLAGFVSGLPRT